MTRIFVIRFLMTRLRSFAVLFFIAGFVTTESASAQIPVSQEPRHHNVFENAWVRVLDVRIPPGDTSLMHKHETPSVFMVLSKAKSGSQVLVEPAKINLTQGNIWYESFATGPRIHRVWNSDTSEFHVIDMELLNKTPKSIDPPLNGKDYPLLFDEKQVRGYRFTLNGGEAVMISPRLAPILVVGLSQASGTLSVNDTRFLQTGSFKFEDAGQKISISNNGKARQELALYELK
jgi:hypothetical protein